VLAVTLLAAKCGVPDLGPTAGRRRPLRVTQSHVSISTYVASARRRRNRVWEFASDTARALSSTRVTSSRGTLSYATDDSELTSIRRSGPSR